MIDYCKSVQRASRPAVGGLMVPVLAIALLCLTWCCGGEIGLSQSETIATPADPVAAQTTEQKTEEKIERLAAAVAQVEAQMQANQKLLIDLQHQLIILRQQMAQEKSTAVPETEVTAGASPGASDAAALVQEIKEHFAINDAQIATHEQSKVESQSKYPLTLSGLFLMNGFINTHQVDVAASPAYALPGSGSTGLSLRQTVMGLDARGPHLFGAASHADIRVDFFGNDEPSNYSAGFLRLRTAHAALNWSNTEAFFELDRSILEPNAPTSLVAIAQPELAWAGNLWMWNPQIGVTHQIPISEAARLEVQAALIDVADPHLPALTARASKVTQSERSRWPGTEGRIAILGGEKGTGLEIGLGGYFSPHRTTDNVRFNAWTGTMDLRLPLTRHFQLTANGYRGQGLGGLGGGGYVDYYYEYANNREITRALKDIGGWSQLKARAGQRIETNLGFGIDNPFAKEIRTSIATPGNSSYPGLARNRAMYVNVIYSPSTYLLLSLEYRRFWSNLASGSSYPSDAIGIGAGYKF